jgi:hypothetical protein
MLYRIHVAMTGFELPTLVVIGTGGTTTIHSQPRRPLKCNGCGKHMQGWIT